MLDPTSSQLLIPRLGSTTEVCFPAGAIVLYHDTTIVDGIIRVFSGSYWTHVGIALGDGRTICAWFGQGVTESALGDGAQGQVHVEARMPPAGIDPAVLVAAAVAQLGKPYDIVGWPADPLANLLHRWRRLLYPGGAPREFHCSELVAWALLQQRPDLAKSWGYKTLRAVTPQDVGNLVGL